MRTGRSGGLTEWSFLSRWFITTIEHTSIVRGVGEFDWQLVDEIITDSIRYPD
jgi:hypothetical protein